MIDTPPRCVAVPGATDSIGASGALAADGQTQARQLLAIEQAETLPP
jgi:hypothetical protein